MPGGCLLGSFRLRPAGLIISKNPNCRVTPLRCRPASGCFLGWVKELDRPSCEPKVWSGRKRAVRPHETGGRVAPIVSVYRTVNSLSMTLNFCSLPSTDGPTMVYGPNLDVPLRATAGLGSSGRPPLLLSRTNHRSDRGRIAAFAAQGLTPA